MAKQKSKKLTEAQRVRKILKEHGFKPVTDEVKKQWWYKQDLEQLENWRREELGKPLTVRERQALYGTDQTKTAKVNT